MSGRRESSSTTFANEQIGPITAGAGVPAPPEVTVYEVHT
jgi:hypothetical protein